MLFETIRQIPQLLAMLYCGIILGILYDLLGLLRRTGLAWLVHIADILFCAATLLCCSVFVLVASEGNIRFYHFLGIILGFLLESKGLKPIIKFLLDILLMTLYNLYKFIFSLPIIKKLTK